MSKHTFDVLVAGELNVDIILNKINKLPQPGQEQRAEEMTLTMGSSTAIFASNISKLGSSVSFLGKIGDDHYGKYMIDSLESFNVNTDSIITDPGLQTGATVIFILENDRMMVTYPGAMEHLAQHDISDHTLRTARHIHTSTIFFQPTLKQGLTELFSRAKKLGLTTSMDTQWDPEEVWDLDMENLFPHLDFFMPNESELLHLTQAPSVLEALDMLSHYKTCVVVKRGAKGAILQHQHNRMSTDALQVPDIVDTVGAGDSFNAGFINAFLNEKSFETCLKEGIRTAAVSITAAGGVNAINSYQQIVEKTKQWEKERTLQDTNQ